MGWCSWLTSDLRRERNEDGVLQWATRQLHQRRWVVVARDAIRVQAETLAATVDQRPFAVVLDPNANRSHGAAASAAPITWKVVNMNAPEATGAMVAMSGAERVRHHR